MEEDLIPSQDDVQERYIEKEMLKHLCREAASLEEPYREVFFLRLEGLSFRRIGQLMEKSENWARVTYFRAKTKIKLETEDVYG